MKSRGPCLQFVGRAAWYALAFLSICLSGTPFVLGAEGTLPVTMPDFQNVMQAHGAQLTEVKSDKEAINLFVSSIGPALLLGDVAKTLSAKSLSPKLSKDLLVPEITEAAQRLIGDLATWHLAATVQQTVKDNHLPGLTEQFSWSSTRHEWLALQGRATWVTSMNELVQTLTVPEGPPSDQGDTAKVKLMPLLQQSARLEVETLQATYRDWDRLRAWKDRVRTLRGQARLCGTWQWVIHNHQRHHQEQKLSVLFPPPG